MKKAASLAPLRAPLTTADLPPWNPSWNPSTGQQNAYPPPPRATRAQGSRGHRFSLQRLLGSLGAGALLLLGVGCATSQSHTASPTSTHPEPGQTRSPEQVLASARTQVDRLSRELEKLRGLSFRQPVPVELQNMEEFRSFVLKELDKTLSPEQAEKDSFTMRTFGLVPEGFNLRDAVTDLMVSEAGAYYNPETGRFYILQTWLPPKEMETLVIHELDHALQDQTFDLKKIQAFQRSELNEDRKSAISFLLEGEATYVMLRHQLAAAGQDPERLPPASQEMLFSVMRDLDQKALVDSLGAQNRAAHLTPDQKAAMEKTKKLPPYLLWNLYSPYMKGQYAVFRSYQKGGWDEVAKLYKDLPESTEQLLHPPLGDHPLDHPTSLTREPIEAQLGANWSLVTTNTLGEAGLLAFFDQHLGNAEKNACAGWDGDTYSAYKRADGASLLYWQTVWDSTEDALEFARIVQKVTRKKLLGPQKSTLNLPSFAKVVVEGTSVRIIAGLEEAVLRLK